MAKCIRFWVALVGVLGTASGTSADEGAIVNAPPLETRESSVEDDLQLAQEDRIAELERKVKILVEELERTRSEMALPGEAALDGTHGRAPAASKIYEVARGLSVGGYGEANYRHLVSDKGDDSDRADALRTVLYVGYKFTDRILFNTELEWEHATTEATETSSGGSVSVEFATLDFLWKDWMNFRAGLVLVPMGMINEIHEPPSFFGVHRPEVERQIIPSTWRENGVGIFGDLGEQLEYEAYVVNGLNAAGFRSSGLRDGRQDGNFALAEDLAFVGKINWYPIPDLLVSSSFYHGDSGQDQDLPDVPTTIWEIHGQYERHGWHLRGLFTMAHIGDAGPLSTALGEGIGSEMLGVYGEVGYNVLPLIFPETEKSLSPFFRAEYYDTQRDMKSGFAKDESREIQIYTAGFSFKPISNVVIKADYRNRSAASGDLSDEINMGIGFAF